MSLPSLRSLALLRSPAMEPDRAPDRGEEARLVRGLGTWDAALLTIGSVVGTGIFLTTSDMARVLPDGGLILWVWIAGGLLTLAGALTYAELGVMFPRAGGLYHYLKEAYGPLVGFLYGWIAFLVIMSGGIATIAGETRMSSLLQKEHAVPLPGQDGGQCGAAQAGTQDRDVVRLLFVTEVSHRKPLHESAVRRGPR